MFKGLHVGVGDEKTFADTDGREPSLTNHPADGLGVKSPALPKLRGAEVIAKRGVFHTPQNNMRNPCSTGPYSTQS